MIKYLISFFFLLMSLDVSAFGLAQLKEQLNQSAIVEGRFQQERHLHSLPEPIVSHGIFVLRAENSLLWHLQEPFEEKLRVSKMGIERWNGTKWEKNTSSTGQSKNHTALFMDLLAGRTDTLQQHFHVQLNGNKQNWQMQFQPKTLLMQQIFKYIDVEGSDVVRRIVLSEKQGDKMVLLFSDIHTQKKTHDTSH